MKLFEELKKEITNIFAPLLTQGSPGASQPQKKACTPPIIEPQNISNPKVKNHKVAGVTHYKDNILSFGLPNPQFSLSKKELMASKLYDVKIYEYSFQTGKTELIPEPSNPHDPNAIKVIIDGKHVGYIKSGSCKHILNLLNENRIEKIGSQIVGGKYKFLWHDMVEEKVMLDHEDTAYGVIVSITER